MADFLRYWLAWPSVESIAHTPWGWPLAESLHFIGLILLIGAIGMFDLRLLGFAKGLPIAPLRKLLPWGVFGFILCVMGGLLFVLGLRANIQVNAYDVILTDPWLQLKLVLMGLVGINLLLFYVSGMSRAIDHLGPDEDAPPFAKAVAGASLFLWLGIIYWGRLIPWGLG